MLVIHTLFHKWSLIIIRGEYDVRGSWVQFPSGLGLEFFVHVPVSSPIVCVHKLSFLSSKLVWFYITIPFFFRGVYNVVDVLIWLGSIFNQTITKSYSRHFHTFLVLNIIFTSSNEYFITSISFCFIQILQCIINSWSVERELQQIFYIIILIRRYILCWPFLALYCVANKKPLPLQSTLYPYIL